MEKDYCLLCGQEMYPPLLDEVNDSLKDENYLVSLITLLQNKLKELTDAQV